MSPSARAEPIELDPAWLDATTPVPRPPPEPGLVRGTVHGSYQARVQAATDFPVPAWRRDPATTRLEQTERLWHWLRLTPVLQVDSWLTVIGQVDFPKGLIGGRPTEHVTAATEPFDHRQPLRSELRWLFVELAGPTATARLGQQPAHWGLGLVENDGDHPPRFGDVHGGTRVERAAVTWRPEAGPLDVRLLLATDLVLADPRADLRAGDRALRAVAAIEVERGDDGGGLLAVYRHQQPGPARSLDPLRETELESVMLDATARFAAPLGEDGFVFGAAELAAELGTSSLAPVRADQTPDSVRAFGAAAELGAVLLRGRDEKSWGRWVFELEWGYASGDADPYDGVARRFTFAPGYQVGLLLFPELLAWQTARAETIGNDPLLSGAPRPEGYGLASDGSLFGATYVWPQAVFRPHPRWDVQAGALVAQATSDVVDPVRVFTDGAFVGYRGGDSRARDLGLELELGTEVRLPTPGEIGFALGVETAACWPGRALARPGEGMPNPHFAAVGRFGLSF